MFGLCGGDGSVLRQFAGCWGCRFCRPDGINIIRNNVSIYGRFSIHVNAILSGLCEHCRMKRQPVQGAELPAKGTLGPDAVMPPMFRYVYALSVLGFRDASMRGLLPYTPGPHLMPI